MSTVGPVPVIHSPCVGICTLDDSDHCLGCRRHISEIAAWLRMSEEERRRILDQLPMRYIGQMGGKHPKQE